MNLRRPQVNMTLIDRNLVIAQCLKLQPNKTISSVKEMKYAEKSYYSRPESARLRTACLQDGHGDLDCGRVPTILTEKSNSRCLKCLCKQYSSC